MTKILGLLLICSLSYSFAQPPAGVRGGGFSASGRFYGRIVDGNTNKGIDASSVQLTQIKVNPQTKEKSETIISGQLTKPNGDFSLENLPTSGEMKLKITAIGYLSLEKSVK